MSERMMRCEDCDDLYPPSALGVCGECDILLCAACRYVHDCTGDLISDGDDGEEGITYAEYVEAEAKLAAWNARVAELNAAARSQP